MKITDNLTNDISNAPDWFLKAINEIGKVETRVLPSPVFISDILFLRRTTVSYTHLTLPTNREV